MHEMRELGGTGGVIMVTPAGEAVYSFNTPGMYRGEASPGAAASPFTGMNDKVLKKLLLALLLALTPSQALGWWDYGHRTVARIAMLETSPRSRAEIARLLLNAPRLDTPTCSARTLEDASVWPDCIRAMGDRFSYTAPWHYQNVNVCKPFDAKAACRDGNCVSAQIERQVRLLKDKKLPARERLAALAFLTHFVGDMHQPMHSGDRDDLGGNRFPAFYSSIRSNLHAIWDGYLAERAISTPAAEARGLLSEVAAAERPAMTAGLVTDWAREAWEVSREFAYGGIPARSVRRAAGPAAGPAPGQDRAADPDRTPTGPARRPAPRPHPGRGVRRRDRPVGADAYSGTTVTARRLREWLASSEPNASGRSLPKLTVRMRPEETPRDSR
jgi:hypothetical protein